MVSTNNYASESSQDARQEYATTRFRYETVIGRHLADMPKNQLEEVLRMTDELALKKKK